MMDRSYLRRCRGERFLTWLKRTLQYRLEHVRFRDIVVDRETGETARWYPDHAGGSMHHEDWWALVKSHELVGLEERFASNERDFHICKRLKMTPARWKSWRESIRNSRWDPFTNDVCIYVPCEICRSSSCCRPDEHGITAIYERVRSMS